MYFIRPDTWRLFCSFKDTAHDLVSHQSHIWFLKECSSNNIITYGLRHECKLINEDENFLRRCQRKLNRVNLELQNDLIQQLSLELKDIRKKLPSDGKRTH